MLSALVAFGLSACSDSTNKNDVKKETKTDVLSEIVYEVLMADPLAVIDIVTEGFGE